MVFCGSTSGNLWRQARLLISAVFASVVAFAWVDAFRATREWATFDMPDNSKKAGVSALLAFVFALVGVTLALLIIMTLLKNDNEEVTSLSETLKIDVTDAKGTVSESKQFSFDHAGHLKLQVEGKISSSIVTDMKLELLTNGESVWSVDLGLDSYPDGGTFVFSRSVRPISGQPTNIELRLSGEPTDEVDVSVEAIVTVTDGELCSN